MEALQFKYKELKNKAKELMKIGNLKGYFSMITEANKIHLEILQYNLQTK